MLALLVCWPSRSAFPGSLVWICGSPDGKIGRLISNPELGLNQADADRRCQVVLRPQLWRQEKMDRRAWLIGSGLCVLGRAAFGAPSAPSLAMMAREGGVVLIRHTSTEPGVGDPPGLPWANAVHSANLSEVGRSEAIGIGAWFSQHGLPTLMTTCHANKRRSTAWWGREDCAFGELAAEWSVVSCWSCLFAVVARTRVTHSPQHRPSMVAAKAPWHPCSAAPRGAPVQSSRPQTRRTISDRCKATRAAPEELTEFNFDACNGRKDDRACPSIMLTMKPSPSACRPCLAGANRA